MINHVVVIALTAAGINVTAVKLKITALSAVMTAFAGLGRLLTSPSS